MGLLTQSPPYSNLFSPFWLPGVLHPELGQYLSTLLHTFCNYNDVQGLPVGGHREDKKQWGFVSPSENHSASDQEGSFPSPQNPVGQLSPVAATAIMGFLRGWGMKE